MLDCVGESGQRLRDALQLGRHVHFTVGTKQVGTGDTGAAASSTAAAVMIVVATRRAVLIRSSSVVVVDIVSGCAGGTHECLGVFDEHFGRTKYELAMLGERVAHLLGLEATGHGEHGHRFQIGYDTVERSLCGRKRDLHGTLYVADYKRINRLILESPNIRFFFGWIGI